MKEAEYWDKICQHSFAPIPTGQEVIGYNWPKLMKIVRNLLGYSFRGLNILEIGAGLALAANGMRQIGAITNYVGVDISPKFCEKANDLIEMSVKCCRVESMPFDGESFDFLWAFDVLEHIHPDDRRNCYREIKRVLKPEYIVFINNPLTLSKHDPEFEHEFGHGDLTFLMGCLGAKLKALSEYKIKDYRYQWIVLESEQA